MDPDDLGLPEERLELGDRGLLEHQEHLLYPDDRELQEHLEGRLDSGDLGPQELPEERLDSGDRELPEHQEGRRYSGDQVKTFKEL